MNRTKIREIREPEKMIAVDIERLSAHNLRHTACTNMAGKGMNIKVLQYIMGHAHCDVTMDVYNHISNMAVIREEIARYEEVAGISRIYKNC